MRITSLAITNSVPRCAPLITTSLHLRRLTVAGVASRRIRVPVKCSIVKWYHAGGVVSAKPTGVGFRLVLRTRWGFALAALAIVLVGAVAHAQPASASAAGTAAPAKPSDAPLPS